jgi:S-adenosylmethionine hydrolase
VATTYSAVPAGVLLTLVGSSGLLEIAMNQGSAARLGVRIGDPVMIQIG